MTIARILYLKARPKRGSDHAFEGAGIIESTTPGVGEVGATVAACDVRGTVIAALTPAPKDTGIFPDNADALRARLAPLAAMTLVNDVLGVDLDAAIARRQAAWLGRYKHADGMLAAVKNAYPARRDRLQDLLDHAREHRDALEAVYAADKSRDGVMPPATAMTTTVAGVATLHTTQSHENDESGAVKGLTQLTTSRLATYDGQSKKWNELSTAEAKTVSQVTTTASQYDELRHPRLENQIRFARVSADVLGELLDEEFETLRVPELERIWKSEVLGLDLEVRRLQVQFISTFLLPRIGGRVTAVMRGPGEAVRAGDPVLRIEANDVLHVAGAIRYPALLKLGDRLTIEARNAFESSPVSPLKLSGPIVSLRGFDGEPDRWNVVIEVKNDPQTPLPPGYDFDPSPDFTKITVA